MRSPFCLDGNTVKVSVKGPVRVLQFLGRILGMEARPVMAEQPVIEPIMDPAMGAASSWRDWIDALDSPGGHNLISFLALVLGVVLEAYGKPGGEELRIAFMGSLIRGMVGAESNVKRYLTKRAAALKAEVKDRAGIITSGN